MGHELITIGALEDCTPGHVAGRAMGELYDPFGLVEKTRKFLTGENAVDPVPSPEVTSSSAAAPTIYNVAVDAVHLRQTPGGTSLGLLMMGAAVEVLDGAAADLWWRVRDAQGRAGYVAQHDPNSTKPYLVAAPLGATLESANQAPAVEVVRTSGDATSPSAADAPAEAPMSTGKKIAIGVGVVAAAAGLYYALGD